MRIIPARLGVIHFCIANCILLVFNILDVEPVTVCVNDCSSMPDGHYQSCYTCRGYVSCASTLLYNRLCATTTVWDDHTVGCVWTSTTCLEDQLLPVPATHVISTTESNTREMTHETNEITTDSFTETDALVSDAYSVTPMSSVNYESTPHDEITLQPNLSSCAAIPTWYSIEVIERTGLTVVYQCADGYRFDNNDNEQKTTRCLNGTWTARFKQCFAIPASELDSLYVKPVEAEQAVVIGSLGLFLVVAEIAFMVVLDLTHCCSKHTTRQSEPSRPRSESDRWSAGNSMELKKHQTP